MSKTKRNWNKYKERKAFSNFKALAKVQDEIKEEGFTPANRLSKRSRQLQSLLYGYWSVNETTEGIKRYSKEDAAELILSYIERLPSNTFTENRVFCYSFKCFCRMERIDFIKGWGYLKHTEKIVLENKEEKLYKINK